MRRFGLVLGIASLLLLAPRRCSGLADDPTVKGKTAAEWRQVLEKDPNADQRRGALLALSILGPKVAGVVRGVSVGLKDADASVRESAAQTLGEMAPEATDGLKALAAAVESDQGDKVREAAARAIGRFGPAAKTSVSSLAGAHRYIVKSSHPRFVKR